MKHFECIHPAWQEGGKGNAFQVCIGPSVQKDDTVLMEWL